MNIYIGCFEEKLSKFWDKKAGATDPEGFDALESRVLKFMFAIPTVAETKSVNLSSFFELAGDFKNCGAIKVTSFSDEA